MAKQEFWTKQYAADYLGLSVRQLMDISLNQSRPERHRQVDPATQRETVMFLRADIEAYKRERTPTPAEERGVMLRPQLVTAESPAPAPAAPVLPWVTIAQASALSGLPASVLLHLIGDGRLGAIDCGPRPGGRYRVRRVDLERIECDKGTPVVA